MNFLILKNDKIVQQTALCGKKHSGQKSDILIKNSFLWPSYSTFIIFYHRNDIEFSSDIIDNSLDFALPNGFRLRDQEWPGDLRTRMRSRSSVNFSPQMAFAPKPKRTNTRSSEMKRIKLSLLQMHVSLELRRQEDWKRDCRIWNEWFDSFSCNLRQC